MSRINGELQKAIAETITKLNNPELEGLIISIVDVDTAADLGVAKVAVSVLSSDNTKDLVVALLNKAKSFIRHEVMRMVRLRTMPDLIFIKDDSYEKSQKLMSLFEKVANEDRGE